MLTPDGQTVVCATQVAILGDCGPNTPGQTLEIDGYSTLTGKRERVLYRYTGHCSIDGVGALDWVGPGNAVVATVNAGIVPSAAYDNTKSIVGVLARGTLVPLVSGTLNQGAGAIAF